MTDPSLRIVFAGTPDFAATHLDDLVKGGFNVVAAYSQPDRPVGRGKKILPTPVKAIAQKHGIPVYQPENLNKHEAEQLAGLDPDVMVVVAYGLILSNDILQVPRYGCINVHASLLPRWRGAAPIERAILAGDAVTGVSIMQMAQGLDTGDVLLRLETPVGNRDNAETITTRLQSLGSQGLADVLAALPEYQARAEKQDDSLTCYAKKLDKQEALINWSNSAIQIQRQIQALFPRSPAYFNFQNNRVRVIEALSSVKTHFQKPGTILEKDQESILVACGDGALEIRKVQLPGKNASPLKDVFNGRPELFEAGEFLGPADAGRSGDN